MVIFVKFCPPYKISPLFGWNKPTRHFIKTVLPLPLLPIIKLHWPGFISTETFSSMILSPKPLRRFFTSIIFQQYCSQEIVGKQHGNTGNYHCFGTGSSNFQRSTSYIVSIIGWYAGNKKSESVGF